MKAHRHTIGSRLRQCLARMMHLPPGPEGGRISARHDRSDQILVNLPPIEPVQAPPGLRRMFGDKVLRDINRPRRRRRWRA